MQQVNEFVEAVRSKSDVLLQQKDDLDDRIRRFLGIIDRATKEINDLDPEPELSDDLTVGDVKMEGIPEVVHSRNESPVFARRPDLGNELPAIPELKNTKVCPGCSHVHSNSGKYCSRKCEKREQNRRYRDKLKSKQEDKKKDLSEAHEQKNIISALRGKITSVEKMEKSMKNTSNIIQQRLLKKQQREGIPQETIREIPVTQGPIDPDRPFTPDPEPSSDYHDFQD